MNTSRITTEREKRLAWFKTTIAGSTTDLPPMVVEDVLVLARNHAVDLNTCRPLKGGGYQIGEPRTGLTILADRNGARFFPCRVPGQELPTDPDDSTPTPTRRRISP